MLAQLISEAFDNCSKYKYPYPVLGINFYEALLFSPERTQSPATLLKGKGQIVFCILYEGRLNGTYMSLLKSGKIVDEKYYDIPWGEDDIVDDYKSLGVVEAMRLLLASYPTLFVETVVLRKALLPGIEIPSYYFGVGNNKYYQVDMRGNVNPVTKFLSSL